MFKHEKLKNRSRNNGFLFCINRYFIVWSLKMTRIRYKYCEGVWITEKMIAGKDLIEVMIMPITNTFQAIFYRNASKLSFSVIEHKNLTTLKKYVKNELKNLGVNFEDEIRSNLKLKGEKK
jgi:hypothetical protein